MNMRLNKATKAITLLLILAVSQTYVHANLFESGLGLLAGAAIRKGEGEPSGRLTTRGNNPVSVNGNSARTGETVFSGQQIQTPAGTGATVDLGSMGRVEIAPSTTLTLNFSPEGIRVSLASGCVVLHPGKGVKGVVETSGQGSPELTEAAPGSPVDVCSTSGGAPVVNNGAAARAGAGANGSRGGGLFGLSKNGTTSLLGAAGIIATATTAAVISAPCRRGRNPSPGVPRGRNDECR